MIDGRKVGEFGENFWMLEYSKTEQLEAETVM